MSIAPHIDPRVVSVGAPMRWPSSNPPVATKWANGAAWRLSLPLFVMVILRAIPGPQRVLAWPFSSFYALFGRRQAILALASLWLLNLFTHAIGSPPGGAAVFRHLTLVCAALSVFVIHSAALPRSRTPMLLVWTNIMLVLLMFHSIVFSTMPEVSVLKVISFAMTFLTLLTAWSRLGPFEREVAEKQVRGILIGLAVLSVPLAGVGAGYFRNRAGFQGLLEHPQAFGPMMAILSGWLFATWLTDRRMAVVLVPVMGLTVVWIYLSQARSGALILIAGVITSLASGPVATVLNSSRRPFRLLKGRLAFVSVLVTLLVIAGGPTLVKSGRTFLVKRGNADTLQDAMWMSRGYLVDRMVRNIDQHPMTGIGFGVASSPNAYAAFARDPVFGFVIQATVEKGVLPVAIVEELGWPLAILFAPWFMALFINAIRAGPVYSAVCASALVLNLTECCFFSPGGGGLIVQLLVAMAATAVPLRESASRPTQRVV